MHRQLEEGYALIQYRVLAPPEVHVGDHIRVGDRVIIPHIDHDARAASRDVRELLLVEMHHLIAAAVVLTVIVRGQILTDIGEGDTGAEPLGIGGEILCHLRRQIGVQQEVAVGVLPLGVGYMAVLVQLRPLLTDEAGRVPVGEEAVQQIGVEGVLGHAIQVYPGVIIRYQALEILLAAQRADRLDPGEELLVHSSVRPARELHRHVPDTAPGQIVHDLLGLAVGRQRQRSRHRDTYYLLDLIDGTDYLHRHRDLCIIVHRQGISILLCEIAAIFLRHIHV